MAPARLSLVSESKPQRTPLAGEGPRKTNPYASKHNKLAVAWKQRTLTLPDEARVPGRLREAPACLPRVPSDRVRVAQPPPRGPRRRDRACSRSSTSPGTTRSPAGRATTCGTRRCSASTRCSRWSPMPSESTSPSAVRRHRRGSADRGRPVPDVRIHRAHGLLRRRRSDGKDVGRRRGTNCTSVDAAFLYKTSSRRNRAGAGRVEVHRVLPRRKGSERELRRRPDRSVCR